MSKNEDIRCLNCEDVFEGLRLHLQGVFATHHFHRDLPDFDPNSVLDPQSTHLRHLHKLEEHFEGVFVFRALQEKTHVVYAVDRDKRLIFLRAFSSFTEYKKFLEDRKAILHLIGSAIYPLSYNI